MRRTIPGPHGYVAQAFHTALNSLLYTLSFGRYLWLEGRRSGSTWHNWTHGWKHDVEPFLVPTTEQEIVDAVVGHDQLRVVGAGHSFNAGVVSRSTLSLDAYTGMVDHDVERKQVRVRAGTRVRDVSRMLLDRGLAIVALPSHDAQSVAGILSTDVHGTGRDVGFVSQSVLGLRIVDGSGQAHDVEPEDDLFRAAIGGIGAVGIITEATFQCVDAFRLRQRSENVSRSKVEAELDHLLDVNDHASLYVFPFADHVQLHTWNRTEDDLSRLNVLREYLNITKAALSAALLGDLLAALRLLPRVGDRLLRFQRDTDLVLQSHQGFNRTIYPLHQELEFAVDSERVWEVTDHVLALYEDQHGRRRLPFTLIELRFTPPDHRRSLISPGASGSRQVFVNVVCNQSGAYAELYASIEAYMREIGARPHLGKWCESLTSTDLALVHGEPFEQFIELRRRFDPNGRFRNDFTDRVLGAPSIP